MAREYLAVWLQVAVFLAVSAGVFLLVWSVLYRHAEDTARAVGELFGYLRHLVLALGIVAVLFAVLVLSLMAAGWITHEAAEFAWRLMD